MDFYALNRLIEKVATIKYHIYFNESDPLLVESLDYHTSILNSQYGIYLNDLLFEVYDEYCSDFEVQKIEDYLSPVGVPVEADDFPGINYSIKLNAFPLRIEMINEANSKEIVWKAA